MKIAYLSTDEVNQDLAERLAADCRVSLELVSPRDAAPNGEYDAVVYDLDSWPLRMEVLSRLGNDIPRRAVAVHGYSLDEEQAETLREQGAAVHRRLDAEVFRLLRARRRQTEARRVQAVIEARTPALESA